MIPLPIHYEELERIYSDTLGNDHHTIALTSSVHGEGVSMIAYALARRAAAAGRRTLLVDLNTETRPLAERLGLQGPDWTPVRSSAQESIVDLDGLPMSILSAPVEQAHILEAREEENLKSAVATWRKSFDCIVFDTSPLTRRNQNNILPDVVASVCDASILVVLGGRTAETKISESAQRLKAAGANLIGAIINDRHNPGLPNELCRETHRLDRVLPDLMKKMRKFFRTNAFLMQNI